MDEHYERLRRLRLIGNRRGASKWLVVYPIMYVPLCIYVAINGGWWTLFLAAFLVLGYVWVIRAENRAYPLDAPADKGPD